ncbi:MAG: spermidine/putrescine ABC transporter permease [Legionellales bacterium]|nr:spermidine/putrescine ABC transporter permease [Legionellales bacterium]|tara:strand:+ start:21015 stop:21869 length:855 start_codon:yes stop_codon:yes gene_type:complete
MKPDTYFKRFSVTVVSLWLGLFALGAFLLVISVSFLSHSNDELITGPITLANYAALADMIYVKIFLRSLLLAGSCTVMSLVLGYPFAYLLARAPEKIKNTLLLLVIIPFWTSSLVRSYAIVALLKAQGILNTVLLSLGIIHQPLQLLFTDTAVMIGLVYNLLPFMILPLYANLERFDMNLVDAAKDLGASSWRILTRIIIPISMPGIMAGCILVLLPAMTLFYIPDLLGGAKSILLGNLIQMQFLSAHNWPLGAALSVVLTAFTGILVLVYRRYSTEQDRQDFV